jgi:hypothetical protein
MKNTNKRSTRNRGWFKALFVSQILLLAACGGGDGGDGDGSGGGGGDDGEDFVTPSISLTGTAAAGAPIIGTVTVKGSLGNSRSALIAADGTYAVDVTGLTAPYRLRAEGNVGGRTYRLHSYAEEADVGGNVNITPFTDLIVANAAGQIAESYFDSNTSADLDPAELDAQEAALQAKLQNVLSALGVDSAIDLLNTAFSADHSGLDAALDVVRIEVDPGLQVATITNLLESTSITDSVTDTDDNSEVLDADPDKVNAGVSDIQLIAGKFDELSAAFAGGLPPRGSIDDIFSTDFYYEDMSRDAWLTDIYTDRGLIGLEFSGVAVADLDSSNGTARVTVTAIVNGIVDPEPINWLMGKDPALGWQIRGDQRIADIYFNFHCNDNDGDDGFGGACGINTVVLDDDFTNNGTGNTPIASAKVSIIDGEDRVTVHDVIYLGTPDYAGAGEVFVYNESDGNFYGDWRAFGAGLGETDPAKISAGDIIRYELYTADLDTSVQASPMVTGAPAATYTDTLVYAPSTVPLYPTATAATVSAINDFAIGGDLTIAWTLAEGTRNDEVLVEISDSDGNRFDVWVETFGSSSTSTTFDSADLDAGAASDAGLNGDASTYTLLVRIYAADATTGQAHSRDYRATGLSVPPAASALVCHYQSGWDDAADGGFGAPINPNSFADYEESLATCATEGTPAQFFTAAEVAGKTFEDDGELTTFDALGVAAGTEGDPGTGTFNDGEETFGFEWWVESAFCAGCTHSYLVMYSDETIEAALEGVWFRETSALTEIAGSVYSFHRYSEQFNYSDTVRAFGADGEIWNSNSTLQP